MIDRRDFLIGAGAIAAAASSVALTPRGTLTLANGKKLVDIVPAAFDDWSERPTNAIVTPQSDDSLAAKLYSDTLGRLYENGDGDLVMMLIAYGGTQNDLLQLHRPEVCYPAFGFNVVHTRRAALPLTAGTAIPGRAMLASSRERLEQIAYWTRIGEYLPDSGSDQRSAKLRTEFTGKVPDGVLARFSNLLPDDRAGLELNRRFIGGLVRAIKPADRPMLIGSALAARLA